MTSLHEDVGPPDYESWGGVPRCVSADPDVFFVPKGGDARAARAVCAGCPVREPCLEYALRLPGTDDYGVFGGTTADERTRIRASMGRLGRRSTWAA